MTPAMLKGQNELYHFITIINYIIVLVFCRDTIIFLKLGACAYLKSRLPARCENHCYFLSLFVNSSFVIYSKDVSSDFKETKDRDG